MRWATPPLFLGALVLSAVIVGGAGQPAWRWDLPKGVAPPPVPADNPMTSAKVELGRQLFYDGDLSVDGTTGCFNCHGLHRSFAEVNPTHAGVDGSPGRRNAMSLANVAYLSPLTWADPSQVSLEVQSATPLTGVHPVEMGFAGKTGQLTQRLGDDACYRQMFTAAFPERKGEVSMQRVGMALAAFERTFLSFNSPFDRARRGEVALSDAARRGGVIFYSAAGGCDACHSGPAFSDSQFHDIGTGSARDQGLIEKTGSDGDAGKFRTPGLRNVQLSSPYLHNGSARTLAEAIARHKPGKGEPLSPTQVDDLIAFLGSLTDPTFVDNPGLKLPKTHCQKTF